VEDSVDGCYDLPYPAPPRRNGITSIYKPCCSLGSICTKIGVEVEVEVEVEAEVEA